MSTVLIVLSAADHWTRADGSLYPTGYWAEEFVVIHEMFAQAGHTVALATPGGVTPTADPKSLDPAFAGPQVQHFVDYLASIAQDLQHPLKLAEVNTPAYAAVVVPGGHGPVEDLYKDADMARVLFDADKAGTVIGSVCHGQAALLSAVKPDGSWLFAGRKLTAFSDEEEVDFGTADNAPWLLATTLRERGANYVRGAENWAPFVVSDGHLISGQNPASSAPMAAAVLQALAGRV